MKVRLALVFGGLLAMGMSGGCAAPNEEGHEGGVRWRVGSSQQPVTPTMQASESQGVLAVTDAG